MALTPAEVNLDDFRLRAGTEEKTVALIGVFTIVWRKYLAEPVMSKESPKKTASRHASVSHDLSKQLKAAASQVNASLGELGALPMEADYAQTVKMLETFLRKCHAYAAARFAPILEGRVRDKIQSMEFDTAQKTGISEILVNQRSEVATWVNGELRGLGLCISHDGKPCRLTAASYDKHPGVGRFRLCPIGSQQAVFTRKDIGDFFPLVLMQAPQRVEVHSRWQDHVERSSERKKPPQK
jgi:hypothetical protein